MGQQKTARSVSLRKTELLLLHELQCASCELESDASNITYEESGPSRFNQ